MTEPMTAERMVELHRFSKFLRTITWDRHRAAEEAAVIAECLAEVDRLRAENAELRRILFDVHNQTKDLHTAMRATAAKYPTAKMERDECESSSSCRSC